MDFVTAVRDIFPNYLRSFCSLTAKPSGFFHSRQGHTPATLADSLLFLMISVVIATTASILLHSGLDQFWRELIIRASGTVIAVGGMSVVIWVACRTVGGSGSLEGHFVIYSHLGGVVVVLLSLARLIAHGIVKSMDADRYPVFRAVLGGDFEDADLFGGHAAWAALSLLIITLCVLLAWLIAGWDAFRHHNSLTIARSLAAFGLTCFLSLVVNVAVFFLVAGAR